ncbi:Asp23/Gls24 family envelope stress response protein [Candidatus Bipolaricaulota bacterium]|nr:Asp23/Gls24 family envelope stress response protein [Candidatus Bipolaricaulota bacterium]
MADKRVELIDEDGRISIAEDVITSIARIAADKVDGIAHSLGSGGGGLMSIFSGEDIAPNIKTELSNEAVRLELRISVEYGYPVHEVAQGVQQNVQRDIELLAGVTVSHVDVFVKKVVPPHTHGDEE